MAKPSEAQVPWPHVLRGKGIDLYKRLDVFNFFDVNEIIKAFPDEAVSTIVDTYLTEGEVMGALGALTIALNDAIAPFGVVADCHPLTPMLLRDLLRNKL